MAGADRSAVVSLIKELSDDSILQEARSCEDEEFVSFLLRRERQSPVHIGNYFERIKPLSVWCFRFLKSFLNVKSCSQLFGTLVSYLPGSASWTKEWGETYHWLTEASIDYDMDTWEPWKPAIRWPIDLTLQNRVYFVFIAEFVERLPTTFPANIWSTYLFEIEHRWAKWLISDPSPKGTRWIYGAFLVSKFKTSYHTCYFSIRIFNPVIKTWSSFIQIWYPSIPISSSSIKLLVTIQIRYLVTEASIVSIQSNISSIQLFSFSIQTCNPSF